MKTVSPTPAVILAALVVVVVLVSVAVPAPVSAADSFSTLGSGLKDRESTEVVLSGYFRSRFAALRNLDLDRGGTPSGNPIYPVPARDPDGQWLTNADMRLRTDLSIFAPRGGVVVRARADVLDNVAFGSHALGTPSATVSQDTDTQAVAVRRLYAEAALPFGVLAVGRMANTWGTGMLANGGDGLDQDSTDAVDRIVFATPLVGHAFAIAYDISATGPTVARPDARKIDAGPIDDVRSLTIAVIRGLSPETLARRDAAGLVSVDWGALYAHRWQAVDNAAWLPRIDEASDRKPTTAPLDRGFSAHVGDLWLRVHSRIVDVQAELAAMSARYEQPSIVPGVSFHAPVESLQLGGVLKARIGRPTGLFAGFLLAWASGDPAPGMGYEQPVGAVAPKPGDLHGAQADPPRDNRIDNFRMHRDFRVDRILFRELVGGITDATVARIEFGHVMTDFGAGTLTSSVAGMFARANEATSTPSGDASLGFELNPTLTYASQDGFRVQLQYAALLPLAGFDNPVSLDSADPAQLWRLHVGYLF